MKNKNSRYLSNQQKKRLHARMKKIIVWWSTGWLVFFIWAIQGCFCNVIIGPTHKIFVLLCEIILRIRTSEAKKDRKNKHIQPQPKLRRSNKKNV